MKRTRMLVLGAVLMVFGALALAYQGITYTKREKVLEVGSFQATVDTEKTVPLPPVVGGAALAAGAILVLVGLRKSG